jgi:phosphoglycolate phosphatase
MERLKTRAVLFDFDFTLADSAAGAIECVSHALRRMDLPPAPPSRIRESIGMSLPDGFEFLTGLRDPGLTEGFSKAFIERADQVMADLTSLYEGVPSVLARLKSAGLALGIVSTKFRYRIAGILAREGLGEIFQVIVGGEDTTRHKPDPQGLLLALEQLGCDAVETVYVGDHPIDADAASRAGIPFVASLTGTSSRESFGATEPLGFVEELSELPALLGRGSTRHGNGEET